MCRASAASARPQRAHVSRMRPAFQLAIVALALSASLPVLAHADGRNTDRGSFFVADPSWFAAHLRVARPHGAQQSDAGAAGAAFTLLVGSVAVLAGKRRKDP
jgi:hypothetical protein